MPWMAVYLREINSFSLRQWEPQHGSTAAALWFGPGFEKDRSERFFSERMGLWYLLARDPRFQPYRWNQTGGGFIQYLCFEEPTYFEFLVVSAPLLPTFLLQDALGSIRGGPKQSFENM